MNYFDIVVGVILIFALIKGVKNGLIIELASLAALVLGVFGAVKFSGFTEEWLVQYWNVEYIGIIAFIITFAGIVVLVHLVAKLVQKLVEAVALGLVNRIFGGLFSLLKYAFIISILMAIVGSFDKSMSLIPDETKESSYLYEPLSEFAPTIFPYLHFSGEDVKDKVKNAMEV